MRLIESTGGDPAETELMLEAARRAEWDATHGPPHLRSGRFNPSAEMMPELQDDAVANGHHTPPSPSNGHAPA
jgi:hypothetical protein